MAFSSIGDIWNQWNIRGFVILSLFLQIFLILFAPLRKKTANHCILFLLWLFYLMADWVAAFTIGLISHNQGNSSTRVVEVDEALQAFWASFLLLHLGGPDTITAFSLEDSSLWQRHLLSLIFQIGAAIYVFAQIFPTDKSLVIPTILIFLAGVIKNAERILALHLSSLSKLREWALSRIETSEDAYEMLVQELLAPRYRNFNEEEGKKEAKLPESIIVKHANFFLQIVKVLLTDLIFNWRQRQMSREYFHKVYAMDALRLISVELNFMYEVLHTKVLAIHSKLSYIFRFIAFTNVVIAFVLFNRLQKHQLKELDEEITHSLLFGGIALDVIALFRLVVSDWTIARLKRYNTRSSKLDSLLHKLVMATDYLRNPQFALCEAESNANVTYEALNTPLIFRRWSESISACNLFSEIVKESPRTMYKHDQFWGIITFSKICKFLFPMAEKIVFCFHQASDTIARGCCSRNRKSQLVEFASVKYVSKNPFSKELWIFIFNEVKRKSENANNQEQVRKIFEARGDVFFQSMVREINEYTGYEPLTDLSDICTTILEVFTNFNYDKSIIIWHITTEVWYNIESCTTKNDEREFSKILSDYMMYLLLCQPNVMSSVAGVAQITSNDVIYTGRLFYRRTKDVKDLCRIISIRELMTLGDDSFKTDLLLERIHFLGDLKWKVMSGVWVEMLSYAASHIKGEAHVEVLSKGGELLAFVWLLMAHFGCFYKSERGMQYDR